MHKAQVLKSCSGNGGITVTQEAHRYSCTLYSVDEMTSRQHEHRAGATGWPLCKAKHNRLAAGRQPSYRDTEKHSRTLCSTLTHGKRKLNSLYKGIIGQS